MPLVFFDLLFVRVFGDALPTFGARVADGFLSTGTKVGSVDSSSIAYRAVESVPVPSASSSCRADSIAYGAGESVPVPPASSSCSAATSSRKSPNISAAIVSRAPGTVSKSSILQNILRGGSRKSD